MSDDDFGVRGIIRRTAAALGLAQTSPERTGRPVALVYRGPASSPGCPEAVADLLAASDWDFDIRYVGPDEDTALSAESLAAATLYAQPGGGTLSPAYRQLRRHRGEIRDFVRGGGRYLGFCLGGYLAGATPGFGLLPGDTDRYIASPQATVTSDESTQVQVDWQGRERTLFFQDGPYFWVHDDAKPTVLATYPNRTIAALVADFGAGRVGVVGPHPEATEDWYDDADLSDPGDGAPDPCPARGSDAGVALVHAVMRP